MTTLSVPSIFNAYATPAPCTIWVATGEPPEMMLRRVSEKWPGVCLPPEAGSAGVGPAATKQGKHVVGPHQLSTTAPRWRQTPPQPVVLRHPPPACPPRPARADWM